MNYLSGIGDTWDSKNEFQTCQEKLKKEAEKLIFDTFKARCKKKKQEKQKMI